MLNYCKKNLAVYNAF